MNTELRDKIAEIIRLGLIGDETTYEEIADQILALPELSEVAA